MSKSPLTVGVIGPAGFGGSYLCVELLNRGHTVIGFSRNPQKLGTHPRYIPRAVDLDSISIPDLAAHFEGLDVLVSEYGPHTAGADALLYMPFLETVRTLILAVKHHPNLYFLFVGGAGSLLIPSTRTCCADHPAFFLAYRRAIAASEAHTTYMEDRLGPLGTALRAYRTARLAQGAGRATPAHEATMAQYEAAVGAKDRASDFVKAGRTACLFFEGNGSFRWGFVSPPALYRPGTRTGRYVVGGEEMVLEGEGVEGESLFEGRLTGISVGDLAVAIADEVEAGRLVGRHWSAVGDLSDDRPGEAYVTLEVVEGGRRSSN